MYWYDDDRYLTEKEQLHNAQNVVTLLQKSNKKWDKKSICAILGNMSQESNVNPNLYEKGFSWDEDKGYGLVQWTPRSKYWNWAKQNNLNPKTAESQIKRIIFEIDNNIQWIATNNYPITFQDFIINKNNNNIDYLVNAFMRNYERPYLPTAKLQNRIDFANKCFNVLKFDDNTNDDTPKTEEKIIVPHNIGDVETLSKKYISIINTITQYLNKDFNVNLHDLDNKNYISNGNITLFRYGNIVKVKYNVNMLDKLKNSINEIFERENPQNNEKFPTPVIKPQQPQPPSSNENVKKLVKKATSLKLNSVPYSMYGSRDMVSSGDCSSYIQWIFKSVGIDVGSYTGAQYTFARDKGKLVFDGYSNKIDEMIKKSQVGDFILMTTHKSNFVAGGDSHVVFIHENGKIIHQSAYPNGYGPRIDSLENYVKSLVNYGYGRWALVRYF